MVWLHGWIPRSRSGSSQSSQAWLDFALPDPLTVLLREVAGEEVAGGDLQELRDLGLAGAGGEVGVGAARVERAAARNVDQAGRRALDGLESFGALAVQPRHRAQ